MAEMSVSAIETKAHLKEPNIIGPTGMSLIALK